MELYKKRKDLIHFNWLIFFITFYTVYFCDVLVLLNHSNNITRNWDVFAGCSETRISVVIKHVQHIGIIRAFCLPGGDLLVFSLWGQTNCCIVVFEGDQHPGWHYAMSTIRLTCLERKVMIFASFSYWEILSEVHFIMGF